MGYVKAPITKLEDKFLGFNAVTPNRKFMKLFERADVKNVLVSFHYIRKDRKLTKEILEGVRDRGGLFMTDSGAFSFFNDPSFDAVKFNWIRYVEEYVEWLEENKEYVFSACNLDVDNYVGHPIVNNWNEKYFEPLQKDTNIIYVAHANSLGLGELDLFKKYCKRYDYVAVNESMVKNVSAIYQEAKLTKTSIHGLAWTKPSILSDFPFFSCDSSSWVNYQKYGATPVWDGKNFSQYDKDDKNIRKTLRNECIKYGVKEYEFVNEIDEETGLHNDDEGLTYSLRTWIDVFQSLKNVARTKLTMSVKKMLEGKKVIFMGESSNDEGVVKNKKGLKDQLLSQLKDVEIKESIPVAYTVHEDGSEVATYEKRESKESITEFKERAGDTMVCNYCHVSDKCPKYKKDSTCGFDFAPKHLIESPIAVIDALIACQTERVNRAMFFEKMEGGMPNKVFAIEIRLLTELNQQKINMLMMIQGKGLRITQTTVDMGNLPEQGQQQSGGFASMLMTMMMKK